MARPLHAFSIELDKRIGEILARDGVPGASVAVVSGDNDYLGLYGVKRLGGEEPIGPETAFNVGSTSKAFASAAAAVLVAGGQMQWDDPIRKYIPDFRVWSEEVSAAMTLRDLASNRAGLPRSGICEFGTDMTISAGELVRRLAYVKPAAPWRSRFTYSNVGHTAVALAVERAAGMEYLAFVEQALLTPLGMRHSSGGTRARRLRDQAGWHSAVDGKTIAISPIFTDVQVGSAGMCVSGGDALRWLRLHLGQTPSVLTEQVLAELHLPQIDIDARDLAIWIGPPDSANASYCLGWASSDQNGVRILRHSGSDFGINAYVAFVPSAGVGVAVYLNKDCKASVEIGYVVLDALLNFPPRDWHAQVSSKQLPDTNSTFQFANPQPGSGPLARSAASYVGRYESLLNGNATVTVDGSDLRIVFADAPIFDAALVSLGQDKFLAVPHYPGLVSDSVGARFETEFVFGGHQPRTMNIRGLGKFCRAGTG
jgi:CubicO group peptidase (beta-lactamase class C family)